MVLDSSTLTVELVVGDPLRLSLGGVETALSSLADRSRARSTLGKAGGVAEHGGWVVEGSVAELSSRRSYVEIEAALVDSRDPPAYVRRRHSTFT